MSIEEPTKQSQFQKLTQYRMGFYATWIMNIGLKTGLFRAIADAGTQGIQDDDLAQRLSFAHHYVQVWCRAAYAFELLDWDEGSGYKLAPHMAVLLLDHTDPQYVGGNVQFNAALYEDFLAFPTHLRTGEIWPMSAHDPWLLETIKNATKPDLPIITETVLPQAPDVLARLAQGGTILDIGTGAGFALVHYATRFPRARVIGLEIDQPSIELAKTEVAEAGLSHRIEIRDGDANYLKDESVYDLVTMNVTLHETGGPAAYRRVLSRVYHALKPGGTLLVSELPYPDELTEYREELVYKVLSGLQFHEALVGCGMITKGELRGLLKGADFANVRVASQPNPARIMILAERPNG